MKTALAVIAADEFVIEKIGVSGLEGAVLEQMDEQRRLAPQVGLLHPGIQSIAVDFREADAVDVIEKLIGILFGDREVILFEMGEQQIDLLAAETGVQKPHPLFLEGIVEAGDAFPQRRLLFGSQGKILDRFRFLFQDIQGMFAQDVDDLDCRLFADAFKKAAGKKTDSLVSFGRQQFFKMIDLELEPVARMHIVVPVKTVFELRIDIDERSADCDLLFAVTEKIDSIAVTGVTAFQEFSLYPDDLFIHKVVSAVFRRRIPHRRKSLRSHRRRAVRRSDKRPPAGRA